jgi:hypothetical protein
MDASPQYATLVAMAAARVAAAVGHGVPVNESDLAVLDVLDHTPQGAGQCSFFEVVDASSHPLTSGLWSFYLQSLAYRWDEAAIQDHAVVLPTLRSMHPVRGDRRFDALLDQGAEALACLAWVLYDDEDEDEDEDEGAAHQSELMDAMYRLAATMKQCGNVDLAYDLAVLALDFGPGHGAPFEEIARFACELGIAAGKTHQVAMCSAALAIAAAIDADTHPARQLEAFDLCETALERIAGSNEPYRTQAASALASNVVPRGYLHTLLPPLLSFLPPDPRSAALREPLGEHAWPVRVSTQPLDQWLQDLAGRIAAQRWEVEIDKARLSLEAPIAADQVVADWTHWTVDHPAYRRAVPHSRSVLREANFDQNYVVLTHEITHVLSFSGMLGYTACALRAATLEAEATLWSMTPGMDDASKRTGAMTEGLAPLAPGGVEKLFRAEQSIELCLKGRILQDVWTAWFEGLAMFGELSADPAMDPNRMNVVTACMRNLIDFFVTDDDVATPEQLAIDVEKYIAEFEHRCSAAIAALGPSRLRTYLDRTDVPYLSGYLAIRSMVATWRAASDSPISGADAFALLLHATRYSIDPFIPDLSLRSDLFEAQAVSLMAQWVAALTRISAQEIAAFNEPIARSGTGRPFRWVNMHLALVEPGSEPTDAGPALVATRIKQAFSSLCRPEDVERVAGSGEFTAQLLRVSGCYMHSHLTDNVHEYVEWGIRVVDDLVRLNSILPVGRVRGKFFINNAPDQPSSFMGVQLRTTEAPAEGAGAVNEIWQTVDRSAGDAIAAHYKQAGSPRIDVTRLIDLGGFVLPGPGPLSCSHFFAYKYGDWFDLFGTTPTTDAALRSDAQQYARAVALVSARLYPQGMLAAEAKFIARGELGALRTRDWIDNAPSWDCDGQGSAIEWARHVRQLADKVLDNSKRRARQHHAARHMLEQMQLEHELIDAVSTGNFSSITEQVHHRAEIIEALLRSARHPVADDSISSVAALLADAGFAIFKKGSRGWDCAACPGASHLPGERQ